MSLDKYDFPGGTSPGSPEAQDHKCTCPIAENNYGEGVDREGGHGFWGDKNCPYHFPPPDVMDYYGILPLLEIVLGISLIILVVVILTIFSRMT